MAFTVAVAVMELVVLTTGVFGFGSVAITTGTEAGVELAAIVGTSSSARVGIGSVPGVTVGWVRPNGFSEHADNSTATSNDDQDIAAGLSRDLSFIILDAKFAIVRSAPDAESGKTKMRLPIRFKAKVYQPIA